MTDIQLLTIAASLVAAMFGLLVTVIGFMGARMINKQDEIVQSISNVKDELHDRISEYQTVQADKWNGIERRLSVVETRCVVFHHPDKD